MRKSWKEVSESETLRIKAPRNYLNQRCCVYIHDVGFQQALRAYPEHGGGSSQTTVRYKTLTGKDLNQWSGPGGLGDRALRTAGGPGTGLRSAWEDSIVDTGLSRVGIFFFNPVFLFCFILSFLFGM